MHPPVLDTTLPDGKPVRLLVFAVDEQVAFLRQLLAEGAGFEPVPAAPEQPGIDAAPDEARDIWVVAADLPGTTQKDLIERSRGQPVILLSSSSAATPTDGSALAPEVERWLDVTCVEHWDAATESRRGFGVVISRCLRRAAGEAARRRAPVARIAQAVAHDLNNLSTVLDGNLRLLERGDATDVLREELVRECKDATARLRQVAVNLSSVAAPPDATGGHTSRLEFASSVALIERLLGPRVEVHLDMQPHWSTVACPPALLQAMLLNLALNARDAMPGGGHLEISVDVRSARDPADAAWLRLRVSDSGTGLACWPDEDTAGLAVASQPRRAGLGLRFVRTAMTCIGGRAVLDSTADAGVAVELWFPHSEP